MFPGAYEFHHLLMPGIGSLFVLLFVLVVLCLCMDYFFGLLAPCVFLPPLWPLCCPHGCLVSSFRCVKFISSLLSVTCLSALVDRLLIPLCIWSSSLCLVFCVKSVSSIYCFSSLSVRSL